MAKAHSTTWGAALLVLAVLLVPIGVGGGALVYMFSRPADEGAGVRLRLEAPARVEEGEPFEVAVEVRNYTKKPVEVARLDLAATYLEGFVLVSTEPEATGDTAGPTVRHLDLGLVVQAGTTESVVLRMQAINPGVWTGELAAHLADDPQPVTASLSTRVLLPSGLGTDDPAIDDGPPIIIEPAEE